MRIETSDPEHVGNYNLLIEGCSGRKLIRIFTHIEIRYNEAPIIDIEDENLNYEMYSNETLVIKLPAPVDEDNSNTLIDISFLYQNGETLPYFVTFT